MSAFFLSINRDGSAFEQAIAENMLNAIDNFGADARRLVVQDNFALGYQSTWSVPEEQGERQPLFDESSQTWLLFYGRIDNREHLLASLGLADNVSDAALLHSHLIKFGDRQLEQIIGPFVFVLFDQRSGQVIAARDAMGARYCVFQVTEEHIHIATYELALVAHPSVAYEFNEERVAYLVANMMPDQPSSTINGLTPLNPGEQLTINPGVQRQTFYRYDPKKRIRLANDQQYAAEFRRLLDQAVRRRMRSIGGLGSMLSGGFDSVPISILMAKARSANTGEKRFTALSWVHDRFPEADEREYSSDICQRFGIEQICINCDDVWPTLSAESDTHVDPLVPFSIPYTEFHQAAFREAQQRGIKVMMTGIHGDLLYSHSESIFAELLTTGRWRKLFAEVSRYWSTAPSRWAVFKHFVVKQLPGVQRFVERRRLARPFRSDCLQDALQAKFKHRRHLLFNHSLKALRPQQYRVVLDSFAGEDMAMGRVMEAKYGVERRYPFRDRDLCEFMISVPSDQLYFNHTPRPIVRKAFATELGERMLARRAKTEFSSVIKEGIAQDGSWRPWFNAKQAVWKRFVKQCYFDRQTQHEHAVDLVKWRCAYYDYWNSVCYTKTLNELGQTAVDNSIGENNEL